MATPIYMNRVLTDDDRRTRIFDGAFFLYSAPLEAAQMLDWARGLIEEAFGAVSDPRRAHKELTVEQFAAAASKLKSKFTNDAQTKALCQKLISAMGADPERTYFDLPRMRVIPPRTYLASGVSYNYAPHRDTWYAHPTQLINYWVPIFNAEPATVMSMYVDFFKRPVNNASTGWDYDDWVKNARFAAASNLKREDRSHPVPLEDVSQSADVRIVQNAGDIFMFSTCQLHASVPNETDSVRFSYDLRTINIDDYLQKRGPANIDSGATGSTLKDFLRVSDLVTLDVDRFVQQTA